MAVVTTKSQEITKRDSLPKVTMDGAVAEGMKREFVGVCAVASGDSIASTFIFGSIPSNARVSEVFIDAPDIGTTTAMDLGLYDTTENGGAVVDADFFASAQSLSGGALSHQEVAGESAVFSVANREKKVWEVLGLDSDPGKYYDVVGTLTAAADAAGSIAVRGEYCI